MRALHNWRLIGAMLLSVTCWSCVWLRGPTSWKSPSADAALVVAEQERCKAKAEAGDQDAAWSLYYHYAVGVGDMVQARAWLEKAANLGHSDALAEIRRVAGPGGDERPFGLSDDDKKELEAEAEKGDGEAAYRMWMYYWVHVQDDGKAMHWLARSKELGSARGRRVWYAISSPPKKARADETPR